MWMGLVFVCFGLIIYLTYGVDVPTNAILILPTEGIETATTHGKNNIVSALDSQKGKSRSASIENEYVGASEKQIFLETTNFPATGITPSNLIENDNHSVKSIFFTLRNLEKVVYTAYGFL